MPTAKAKRARPAKAGQPGYVALAAGAAVVTLAAALWLSLPDVAFLRDHDPQTTALMEQRRNEARLARRPYRLRWQWVPLAQISPRLEAAVLLSEDASFFTHGPFDWREMENALEKDVQTRSYARGASTITQQLAKNLFLGTHKSLWRKAKEALIAWKLERALSKRRILALYLNVAEWGDGVFGAEAGAQARFGAHARDLSTAEAAVMAAMLPAPRKVDLARPTPWLRKRARHVLDLLRDCGRIGSEEHLHASAELERMLAGPPPVAGQDEAPPDDE